MFMMIGLSYEISWTFFNCLRFYGQNGDFFSFINKKKKHNFKHPAGAAMLPISHQPTFF